MIQLQFSAAFSVAFLGGEEILAWLVIVLFVSDPHEDDANIHVPTFDRTGESSLHLMLKYGGLRRVPVILNINIRKLHTMVPDHLKTLHTLHYVFIQTGNNIGGFMKSKHIQWEEPWSQRKISGYYLTRTLKFCYHMKLKSHSIYMKKLVLDFKYIIVNEKT